MSQILKSKKPRILIMIFLVLLTISLRLYNWDEKFSFNAEYNYKLWPIQKILVNKDMTLIGIEAVSYIHHIHYPPFFLYLFAPVVAISQFNPASIELSLIFFSGITAYIFWLLGKEIKNVKFGYLLSAIYAISFFAQRADLFIWVVGPIIFFTASFLLILLRSLKEKKISLLSGFLLGLLIGLGLNFHYQVGAILVAAVAMLTNKHFRKKITTKTVFAFLTGILFFTFPLIVFDLRHNFYNLKGVQLLLTYSSETPSFWWRITSTLSGIANIFLGIFFPNDSPTSVVSNILPITFLSVAFLLYLLIALINFTKQQTLKLWYRYCLLLFIVGALMFFFLRNNFNYYLFILQPVIIVLLGGLLLNGWNSRRFRLFTVVLFLFFVTANIYKTITFRAETTWKKQLEAVDFIFSKSQKENIKIHFSSFPSEEYSFLFYYGARKRGINFKNIEFYEPWQDGENAEFIINSKDASLKSTEVKFGNFRISQRKEKMHD